MTAGLADAVTRLGVARAGLAHAGGSLRPVSGWSGPAAEAAAAARVALGARHAALVDDVDGVLGGLAAAAS
ncbi:hypothetical protein, partial [Actinomycetospora chlora]|uniref:hypothetical protein n=1 Tax=Actinomycetospora chlora TaxID=663608 RepID=UPI0031E6849F